MADPIRVLLADDHAVVREGVRSFLQLQEGIEVVGEAGDGVTAQRMAEELNPDVVLMDLLMPEGDGVAAIAGLHRTLPSTRVLVLSSYIDDAQVFNAIQAGAAGYLLKDVAPEALAKAIRDVHAGQAVLHPEAASRLMHRTVEPQVGADLTPRERDVLRLLAEGFPNKEIGRRLFVSEKTVKTHVSSILQKLGVRDRTQAALAAVRLRLLD
ncbi:MAG TPA: response regulator transcription factor [Candidatus Dormibacteraeota bacterium]|nr:response regulator transcription factor [Candidatus Dormibacteraeota bacterium]